MADAVPSVAPEQVAFKNLELATGANNPGVLFTNAFFKGAEINRRRQQLEQQLAIAQMRNYTQEVYHANQMQNWQTQAALKMQEINLKGVIAESNANNMATRLGIMADAVAVNQQKADLKNMQDERMMDQTSGFLTEWQGKNLAPGDKDYWPTMAETMTKYPAFAQSKAGIQWQKASGDQHNLASNRLISANNAQWSGFEKEVKDRYFKGAYTDYSIFDHPEWWQQQYVDDKGNPVLPDAKGAKKSSNVYLDRGAEFALPTNPNARYITVPAAVVQRDRNRYRKLVEERSRIGGQVYDPGAGVYPQSAQGTAPQAPKDPAQRQVGQRYSTPKGELIWTPNGWTQ